MAVYNMVGYRTESSYIERYGLEEGQRRFAKVLERREQRQRRMQTGRTIVLNPNDLEGEIERGNAVRCEACGAILANLSWMHFKRKCSISSTDEYRCAFPGAPLIAPNLSTRMAVTLENMIGLYGEEVGRENWDHYRQQQALTNAFDYKASKYGWTREQFDAYNASRAVTLDGLVTRHGEQEGLAAWERYCERQRYTNTLQYFIEREGDREQGMTVWLNYNHAKGSSRRIPDIAANLGISIDEAAAFLASRISVRQMISEGEKKFIDALETELGTTLKYTYKTRQFCIWSDEANQPFFYDVCCTTRRKIIEYHGDYWHARPTKFAPDSIVPQRHMTAAEIWQLDALKQKAAEGRGFQLLVIWETDFLMNGIAKELIEWLSIP